MDPHTKKLHAARTQLAQLKASSQTGFVSLKPKSTSHFFRERKKIKQLDLLAFTQVLSISEKNLIADVEGLISFKKLTQATLKYGLIPEIVPELRAITVGGTISGLGIESSSFLYGLVHHTVETYEVLTGNGEVVNCSASENADLYYALPNSIGTFGYVTRATIRLRRAKPFVRIQFLRFSSFIEYSQQFETICKQQRVDFIDSVIFAPDHLVIIVGMMIDSVPTEAKLHDFKQDIFWKYIKNKNNVEAYLTLWNYLWRWDTDIFWCLSGNGFISQIVENSLFRKLLGRFFLHSDVLIIMQKFKNRLRKIFSNPKESHIKSLHEAITQDLCISLKRLGSFMQWYEKEVNVFPVWICPYINLQPQKYPLNNFHGDFLLDVGIYKGRDRPLGFDQNYYTKLLEKKAMELGGYKGLYSHAFYSKEDFWKLYDQNAYWLVKEKYDPDHAFPDLYAKCVGEVTL